MEFIILAVVGGVGALIKDVVKDNKLILPKLKDGTILLGCLGGVVIGAVIGYLVDQNVTTAFFSGYAGSQMLMSLAPNAKKG